MQAIREAILSGERDPGTFAALPIPQTYRAVTVHRDEEQMFAGLPSRDKDPRKSLHVEQVDVPELGPGEALVAVMASAINYNTVWTSIFEPVSTFTFLQRYGRTSPLARRHDLPYHVVGSDLSGVVLRTGAGVNAWKPGDEVVAHCLSVELEHADGHNDTMLDPEQRIWGFETNFGGLAELALVKTNQLMPKAAHLTWEEAAVPGLVNSTAYRQLVSRNGAGMKLGDVVLIWGASGGLGSYATQMALASGGHPRLRRVQPGEGRDLPPDGRRAGHRPQQRGLPVLEGRAHPGPARVEAVRRDHPGAHRRPRPRHRLRAPGPGDVRRERLRRPRAAAPSSRAPRPAGFLHEYDNRYLWMNLKRMIGSHFANYREAWEANDLVARGLIHPTLSRTYDLQDVGQAAYDVHRNLHQGKVGVLALAPTEGLGVRDPARREQHLAEINRFRNI